jgi:hypothetical protein
MEGLKEKKVSFIEKMGKDKVIAAGKKGVKKINL